jgi:hypothetical protein
VVGPALLVVASSEVPRSVALVPEDGVPCDRVPEVTLPVELDSVSRTELVCGSVLPAVDCAEDVAFVVLPEHPHRR